MALSYDDIVRMALELPDVEESLAYGGPCLKRKGRMMLAPKEDGETIAVKVDWETHDRLLEERPDIFYKTPHYETWPWFLVRFGLLSEAEVRDLLQTSWEDAPKPGKRRR